MKYGLALPESVQYQHRLGAALDQHGSRPAVVPIWAQYLTLTDDALAGLEQLEERDITPVIFAESTEPNAYAEILAGEWDERIDTFARHLAKLGCVIVRWDQEPNGGFGAPWTEKNGTRPATYKGVFRYVSSRIRAIAPDVRMAYCITWRGRKHADDFARFYPGDAAQVVGFDSYVRKSSTRLWRIWNSARRNIRQTTDKPCWVFEWGIKKGVPRRARVMRSTRWVRGVEGAIYLDMDLYEQGRWNRWGMGHRMRRELGRQTAMSGYMVKEWER